MISPLLELKIPQYEIMPKNDRISQERTMQMKKKRGTLIPGNANALPHSFSYIQYHCKTGPKPSPWILFFQATPRVTSNTHRQYHF